MPMFSLLFFLLVWGMAAGWIAQLILGRETNWGQALIAGIVGSFIGGTLGSLLFDDEFTIRPGGIIGSIVGAVIFLAILGAIQRRKT